MSETVFAASFTVLNRAKLGDDRLWQTHQTHDDFGDDPQRPFSADQQARQISTGLVHHAPYLDNIPVGQHDFQSQDVLLVMPYFRQCMPPAFVETLPPMVETTWLPGSGT